MSHPTELLLAAYTETGDVAAFLQAAIDDSQRRQVVLIDQLKKLVPKDDDKVKKVAIDALIKAYETENKARAKLKKIK